MDKRTLAHRAEIARRLKAARWLAGTIGPSTKGRTGYEVKAITPAELAARDPLPANDLTATKLGAIERMERKATPMELEKIAEALGVARDYFTMADGLRPAEAHVAQILNSPELMTAVLEQLVELAGRVPARNGEEHRTAQRDTDRPG